MPTMAQAGVYSGVRHYLKGVAKAQTTDGVAVAAAMREIPVEDVMTHGARIRDDGWVMRDLYLFQVKRRPSSKRLGLLQATLKNWGRTSCAATPFRSASRAESRTNFVTNYVVSEANRCGFVRRLSSSASHLVASN